MKCRILLCAATLALTGCGGRAQDSGQGTNTSAAVKVTVAAVESHKLDTTLSLPAQVSAYEAVDVYPKVTGFVEEIRVDRGSRVKTGEVIVRLSAPELTAQRSQAEANLQAAEAQLGTAQAKLAADQGTFAHLSQAAKTPGVVAGNDLQIAEQTATADKAQVEAAAKHMQAARDALRSVQDMESYLQIRAPFNGIVTARNLHPGALVGPSSGAAGGQPIVRLERADRLRVTVPVPEAYVAGVRDGQSVAFSVPALPGRVFRAAVARIAHEINPATRTMQVELDYKNTDDAITPGTFANADWPIQRTEPSLFVPASAITTDLQRTFVIRVKQDKAEWVDVKSGVTMNGKTEVFGNLQIGDTVIRNATDAIRPGTVVAPQVEK